MSIIGGSWKAEDSHEEQYSQITGEELVGSNLNKRIEQKLGDSYTSRTERKQLQELQSKIYNSTNPE